MKMNAFKLSLLAAAFASAGAFAATLDGNLSAVSSTGTVDVLLQKGDLVQISELDTLDFGPLTAVVGSVTAADGVCVYSTTGVTDIAVTSLNNGGVGVNRMNEGGGGMMTYTLDIGGTALSHGNTALAVAGANTVAPDCGAPGNFNTTLTATVTAAQFGAAPSGIYSDTVTLIVSP